MQGDKTAAVKSFLESAHADPKFALPLVRAASLEAIQGNMAAALTHSQAAIDLNPGAFPDAYAVNALANITAQNLDAAEKSARQGLLLGANLQYPELEYALGVVLYSKDDHNGATEHLQKYLQEFPNGPNALAARNQLQAMQQTEVAVERMTAAADEQSGAPTKAVLSADTRPAANMIKDKNAPLLKKISAYTCLESVSSAKIDLRGRLATEDIKRVDIGVSDGKEIYGSADGKRFANGSGRDLLGYGFSTTGLFSSVAAAVIAGNQLAVERVGEFSLEGQTVIRYSFRARPSTSGWVISYGKESGNAKEEGWFLVDSKSLFLRRVFVKASEIPHNLKLINLSALIDYEPETIGENRVLLPSIARVELGERTGFRQVSVVSFDHCRAFTTESTISFTESGAQESNKTRNEPLRLPVGLELTVAINSALNPDSADKNDVLTATVLKSSGPNGRELLETGALVEGHIRPKRGENALIVEFDRVHTRSGWAPFYAQLLSIRGSNQAHVRSANSDQQSSRNLRTTSDYEELIEPEIPGVAIIDFSSKTAELPAGTQLVWRTKPLLVTPKDALVPQTSTSLDMK
jgi:hypothetical protein